MNNLKLKKYLYTFLLSSNIVFLSGCNNKQVIEEPVKTVTEFPQSDLFTLETEEERDLKIPDVISLDDTLSYFFACDLSEADKPKLVLLKCVATIDKSEKEWITYVNYVEFKSGDVVRKYLSGSYEEAYDETLIYIERLSDYLNRNDLVKDSYTKKELENELYRFGKTINDNVLKVYQK